MSIGPKQIFAIFDLFCATFSFWDIVNFVFDIHSLGLEIFANLIQTLTSEARVYNPKYAGFRGAANHQIVSTQNWLHFWVQNQTDKK